MKINALREQITALIEKGRLSGVNSEMIADEIFKMNINLQEDTSTEESLKVNDILHIARKALKQAEFDGAMILLSPGRYIRRNKSVKFN